MFFWGFQKLKDAIAKTQKNPKIQIVEDTPYGNIPNRTLPVVSFETGLVKRKHNETKVSSLIIVLLKGNG